MEICRHVNGTVAVIYYVFTANLVFVDAVVACIKWPILSMLRLQATAIAQCFQLFRLGKRVLTESQQLMSSWSFNL